MELQRRIALLCAALTWPLACGPSVDSGGGQGDGAADTTEGDVEDTDASPGAGDVDPGGPIDNDDPGADADGSPPATSCCPVPSGDDRECAPQAMVSDCGSAVSCAPVTVTCPRAGGDLYSCDAELAYDEAALTCALTALRDRIPGRLDLDGTVDYGIFSGQDRHAIWVQADGDAVSAGCLRHDAGADRIGPSTYAVASPPYFDTCLQMPQAADRYECLWAGLEETGRLTACE